MLNSNTGTVKTLLRKRFQALMKPSYQEGLLSLA